MNKFTFYLVAIVGVILLCIFTYSLSGSIYENKIEDKVESIGGKVTSVEYNSVFESDPFGFFERQSKNERVYKFTYTQNGEVKTGWVSFTVFKNYWKMDYKGE